MNAKNGVGSVTLLFFAIAVAPQPAIAQALTARVSIPSVGGESSGASSAKAISEDGRFVVFSSDANDLVPGDLNASEDVFLRDRMTGETTCVSVNSSGQPAGGRYPEISANGRYVAYSSSFQIKVFDRIANTTTTASVDSSGVLGNSYSVYPSLSASGRFVVFLSDSTNLVPGDTNNLVDVFVHDMETGETSRVNVNSLGNQANGGYVDNLGSPRISADGKRTVFWSTATNLAPGVTGGGHIYVHDSVTGMTNQVDVSSTGVPSNQSSYCQRLSADGRVVAFMTLATNLVSGDSNNELDIFVRDLTTGETTLVSVDSGGVQGNSENSFPSISLDGRYVGFSSTSTNLVAGDNNGVKDAFVHDRLTGVTKMVSVDSQGALSNGLSFGCEISGDGRFAAFSSYATNLVVGDANGKYDAFVHGPEFTLEANTVTPGAGQRIRFTIYKGVPGSPASLWAVKVNGTPTLRLVASGSLDADGNFSHVRFLPLSLSGYSITFRGYANGQFGLSQQTNDLMIQVQ